MTTRSGSDDEVIAFSLKLRRRLVRVRSALSVTAPGRGSDHSPACFVRPCGPHRSTRMAIGVKLDMAPHKASGRTFKIMINNNNNNNNNR